MDRNANAIEDEATPPSDDDLRIDWGVSEPGGEDPGLPEADTALHLPEDLFGEDGGPADAAPAIDLAAPVAEPGVREPEPAIDLAVDLDDSPPLTPDRQPEAEGFGFMLDELFPGATEPDDLFETEQAPISFGAEPEIEEPAPIVLDLPEPVQAPPAPPARVVDDTHIVLDDLFTPKADPTAAAKPRLAPLPRSTHGPRRTSPRRPDPATLRKLGISAGVVLAVVALSAVLSQRPDRSVDVRSAAPQDTPTTLTATTRPVATTAAPAPTTAMTAPPSTEAPASPASPVSSVAPAPASGATATTAAPTRAPASTAPATTAPAPATTAPAPTVADPVTTEPTVRDTTPTTRRPRETVPPPPSSTVPAPTTTLPLEQQSD